MSRAAVPAGTERLLHCSPQRTVLVALDESSGQLRACKVFASGSMADAEHETAMAQLCAGAGVVRYLACGTDIATNRPRTVTVFEEGTDLDRLVAEQGALPAAVACRLLAPVAETLAAMHALRIPEAPQGICHGDVKPKNLLQTRTTTILLDFEHARPITPATEGRNRDAPGAAADVHALGTTLQWLVSGGGQAELPQHGEFAALVKACVDEDPLRRPTAAGIAAKLRALAIRLAADPDEIVLDAATRGSGGVPTGTRPTAVRPGLLRLWSRRQRLLRTLPTLLEVPSAHPTEPDAILREIRRANRVLRHFPRHQPIWRWRHELCSAAGRMLAEAAAHIGSLRRAEEFDAASRWLADARELARTAMALPGGCPIPYTGAPTAVGLLHRDPPTFLMHLVEQVDTARLELEAEAKAILDAESRLDLEAAEQAIEAMASHYGGSSPTATRCRDQLHRLGFYVDRIARAQPNVERIGALWDAAALKPLSELVAAACTAGQHRARGEAAAGVVGLRSLQITLVNLGEEFPHLAQTGLALDTLSHALAHLTDHGWQLLAEAERCLRTVPVPVRPLQVALGRLDTYRILEAFVDRPGRPRSQLQDSLESLRLRLDQARATRDRLTEGAEQAMARGHWTTGLFDMERAVADIDPADDREAAEAARLTERLAEARRRKQEVEAAVRRNVELATRYGMLQDDPSSSFVDRLAVLAERRDCLHMLALHAPAERTVLYGNDLRDVETHIALEQAAQAEHRMDGTVDAEARLRIARETLDQLTQSVGSAPQQEPPGRVVRLLEHWRTVATQCQRAVDHALDEVRAEQKQQRRLWRVGAAAALASAGAIVLGLWPWLTGTRANAAGGSPTAFAGTLAARVRTLPAPLRAAADRLVASASIPAEAVAFDVVGWTAEWATCLQDFARASATMATADIGRAFAVACWDAALTAARSRVDDEGRRLLEQHTRQLVESLATTGLRPTAR